MHRVRHQEPNYQASSVRIQQVLVRVPSLHFNAYVWCFVFRHLILLLVVALSGLYHLLIILAWGNAPLRVATFARFGVQEGGLGEQMQC